MDVPVGEAAGLSGRRERWWRVVGVLILGLVGVGSVLVPWLLEGTTPEPSVFTRRAMTVIDYYFLGSVGLGLVFLEGAVVALRRSKYPRTDGARAAMLGTVLCALGGSVLFVRLWMVVHR